MLRDKVKINKLDTYSLYYRPYCLMFDKLIKVYSMDVEYIKGNYNQSDTCIYEVHLSNKKDVNKVRKHIVDMEHGKESYHDMMNLPSILDTIGKVEVVSKLENIKHPILYARCFNRRLSRFFYFNRGSVKITEVSEVTEIAYCYNVLEAPVYISFIHSETGNEYKFFLSYR